MMKRHLGHKVDHLPEMFSGCGSYSVLEVAPRQCSRDPPQATAELLVGMFQVALSSNSQELIYKRNSYSL